MLSYRHSYHAGNHADVLKHIVIIEIFEHLLKKDSPFEYIDTHSGAGLYNLHSEYAEKRKEYSKGIAKLKSKAWPELCSYFKVLAKHNPEDELNDYPGSPLIAMEYLRNKDRGWFYELHSKDVEILKQNTANNKRIKVMFQDGFVGLLSLLPPASRRGLVLIDPSYEIKTDYERVFEVIVKAYKKSATCIYALWYPVVDRNYINQLEKKFINSGIKKIQRFELGISADLRNSGMTASGMIVINPPWQLRGKMSRLLPRLVETLGESKGAFFKCDELVGESLRNGNHIVKTPHSA